MISFGMSQCHILKISDNEIIWFTGEEDFDKGVEKLWEQFPNIRMILLSMGQGGSSCYQRNDGQNDSQAGAGVYSKVTVKAFIQENTIETTGAGDTFCAGILHYILENGLKEYTEDEMRKMLTFANAAASIVTTRKGALRVMPSREEIEKLLD